MSYIPQVSKDPKSLRSGALTSGFDSEPTPLKCQNWNQAVLYFTVVLDTATDVRVRLEACSPTPTPGAILDETPAAASAEWASIVATETGTASGGVLTFGVDALELKFATAGTYAYPLPLNYQWVRAKAKATGTVGSSTLAIRATTGMA